MFIPNPTARLGEDLAADFLSKKGYRIIDRNFRKGYGEIDIIAVKGKVLIFIEVKTRKSLLFGGAKEAIREVKIRKLTRTAQFYKMLHPELPETLRIDAVFIQLSTENNIENIEHIENISGF